MWKKWLRQFYLKALLIPPPSPLECFLLSVASWTHDIGMNSKIARDYFVDLRGGIDTTNHLKDRRKEHHRISAWYLLKDKEGDIFKHQRNEELKLKYHVTKLTRAIAIIIQYHRKTEDIDKCEETRRIKGEEVRIKLLAALLRLADTLHIDSSRVDPNLYAMLQIASYDRASRLHWLKSFFVSNIHLDGASQTITVNLDLPDQSIFSNAYLDSDHEINRRMRDWNDRVRNLEYIILSEIESELCVVNKIFSANNMPTYVNVRVDTVSIPGFSQQEFLDLEGVLSELDILFSPNTSKVIARSLESIKTFAESRFETTKDFKSQLSQLIDYLDDIFRHRPCHVGVRKIIHILKVINNTRVSDDSKKEKMRTIVSSVNNVRKEAKECIYRRVREIIHDDIKYIFLLGFSSTIVGLMKQLSPDSERKVKVYVLECGPKRRYSSNNQMEYNDGIHYACEISKLGGYDVSLIPDSGFPTILNFISEEIERTSVLLLGANGIGCIDKTKKEPSNQISNIACGHSSGHLSAVLVARYFGIPIKILADSFKVGEIEWQPKATRDSEWLTTQERHVKDLDRNKIERLNYREDRIPMDLIDELHTDIEEILRPKDGDSFVEGFDKLMEKAADFFKGLKNIVSEND